MREGERASLGKIEFKGSTAEQTELMNKPALGEE